MSWSIFFEWHSGTIDSYREDSIFESLKRAKRVASAEGYKIKSISIVDDTQLPPELEEEFLFLESRFDDKMSDPNA